MYTQEIRENVVVDKIKCLRSIWMVPISDNSTAFSNSVFDKSATKSVQLSQRLKVISKCSISTIPSYFFTNSRFILRTSLQISKDDKEDIFNDQELFGSNNCVIAKVWIFQEVTSLRMNLWSVANFYHQN